MFPFLSPKTNRKDQAVARSGICLFALLFFLCALLSSLPSFGSLTEFLSEKGLAGYTSAADARSDEHSAALSRFSDRPLKERTSSATAQTTQAAPDASSSPDAFEPLASSV